MPKFNYTAIDPATKKERIRLPLKAPRAESANILLKAMGLTPLRAHRGRRAEEGPPRRSEADQRPAALRRTGMPSRKKEGPDDLRARG